MVPPVTWRKENTWLRSAPTMMVRNCEKQLFNCGTLHPLHNKLLWYLFNILYRMRRIAQICWKMKKWVVEWSLISYLNVALLGIENRNLLLSWSFRVTVSISLQTRTQSVDLNTDTSLVVDISDALSERERVKFTVHTKVTKLSFRLVTNWSPLFAV